MLASVYASHTPLMRDGVTTDEVRSQVDNGFARLARRVRAFSPDLIIQFSPDHFNGFFYELMPQFCIGLAATSIGDFGSTPGPLDVPRDIAEGLAQAALDGGVDLAVSLRMEVDHGMVQPLEILFGGLDTVPTVPFFLNSVAPPFTPVRRVRALGEALGRYLSGLDKRVAEATQMPVTGWPAGQSTMPRTVRPAACATAVEADVRAKRDDG